LRQTFILKGGWLEVESSVGIVNCRHPLKFLAGSYTPATQDTLGQIPLNKGIGVVQRVKAPQPFESNLGDFKVASQLTQLTAVTFIAN
jgi:hypothetical protein